MKKAKVLFVVAMVSLTASVSQAEFVTNGGFIGGVDNEGTPGWTKNEDPNGEYANAIDTMRFQRSGFARTSGPGGPSDDAGLWFRSFEGNNGTNPGIFVDGTATQTVSGLVSGEMYEFSAFVKLEANHMSDSIFASLDGDLNFDLKTGVTADGTFQQVSTMFTYTGGPGLLTIGMDNGSDSGMNPQSIFVDDVSIVPEPNGILLIGLGSFVFGMFRRRIR